MTNVHRTDKRALRLQVSRARSARTPDELSRARVAICAIVLDHCAGQGWRCVAAYVPLPTEPGSTELLAGLDELGARVLVPVLRPDRDLNWAHWRPGGVGAPLGVTAIASADAVLVPALAVAPDGTRLGRGGGSYDRALARVGAGVPVAALLFTGELVPSLPRDTWDMPVTAAVTQAGWTDLRGSDAMDGNAGVVDDA